MPYTKHARRQAQRRGIDDEVVELTLAHGEASRAGSDCHLYHIPRRVLKSLQADVPPMLWRRYRDRLARAAVIEAGDGSIVTVMHRLRSRKAGQR